MKYRIVRAVVLICGLLAIVSVGRPAEGLEVGAFSIEKYELAYDDCAGGISVDWKDEIEISNVSYDSFGASEGVGFFEAMNPPGTCQHCNCSGAGCATPSSRTFARKNDGVTPSNMASMFSQPDLVFFYGHNVTLESAQFYNDIGVWTPTENWRGCKQTIPQHFWGTMIFPYYYQESPVFDANYEHNSYPVFYAYKNFTSILFGKDFIPGTWYTEDSYEQSTADEWSGNLGSNVNWFIGNGCRALPMADYTVEPHEDPRPSCMSDPCSGNQVCQEIEIGGGWVTRRCTTPCTSNNQCVNDWNVDPNVIWCGPDQYHGGDYCHYSYGSAYLLNLTNLTETWWEEHPVPQGIYAWWPSWGNMHMVLGHYYSISPGAEPNAVNIATDLKAGGLVVDAYFDNHGFEEYWDQVHPGWGEPAALKAVQDGGPDYFASDTWTSPQADPTNLDGFGIAYRVNVFATIYYRNYVIVD